MNDQQKQQNEQLTADQFTKRLVNLCLRSGLAGMPKDAVDQHILLKSAILMVKTSGPLSEKEVNDTLQAWLTQVCVIKNFDRVTLRRRLVDTGYLTRNSDGSGYQVARPGPRPELFDTFVDAIDPREIIRAAREEMERRKQVFMAKNKGA
jgi:hypothetical protein